MLSVDKCEVIFIWSLLYYLTLLCSYFSCLSVGAKEAGAAGFFKGLGKGVVGVLARPAGGLVDFASSTLEGIKGLVPSSKFHLYLPSNFRHIFDHRSGNFVLHLYVILC